MDTGYHTVRVHNSKDEDISGKYGWVRTTADLVTKSEPKLPDGMRSVQSPAGTMYRASNKDGSDMIQINPVSDNKYELVVYDPGRLSPSYKSKSPIDLDTAIDYGKRHMNRIKRDEERKVSAEEKKLKDFGNKVSDMFSSNDSTVTRTGNRLIIDVSSQDTKNTRLMNLLKKNGVAHQLPDGIRYVVEND